MSRVDEYDQLLVRRIRDRDDAAWSELIARFEGRLLAFVESRLHQRAASEDVVQETFVGFLTSLPNYDGSRPLETYLFSIAAHKLTDHLRREGRRPTVSLAATAQRSDWDPPAGQRAASTLFRSRERQQLEAEALRAALAAQLERWRAARQWEKIQVAELLFVRGWANKEVAARMGLSEQQVANQKYEFLARVRSDIRKQGLSHDVFPELADTS